MKRIAIGLFQFWINNIPLACTCIVLGVGTGHATAQSTATVGAASVTAIDILLLPDSTMIQHAAAVNERLRSVFPKGFTLDASHHPHVTLFQCFVRTEDLAKVYAAANKVLEGGSVKTLKLTAFKHYYIPDKGLGLAGIVIEPTVELIKLQSDLIAAVAPFTVKTAASAAFVTTPEDPVISPQLIQYIEVFVTEHAGTRFEPHVTTGLAPKDYLDQMLAEPFDKFTFSPNGAAVYQLGQYGTAAKKLKDLNLTP